MTVLTVFVSAMPMKLTTWAFYGRLRIFLNLDLGIVSPDMHIYKNEYRLANRSFGELISLTIGKNQISNSDYNISYYLKLVSSGEFGIDGMQDLMHRILTLQPVNYVNDLVRMPDETWYGLGGRFQVNSTIIISILIRMEQIFTWELIDQKWRHL